MKVFDEVLGLLMVVAKRTAPAFDLENPPSQLTVEQRAALEALLAADKAREVDEKILQLAISEQTALANYLLKSGWEEVDTVATDNFTSNNIEAGVNRLKTLFNSGVDLENFSIGEFAKATTESSLFLFYQLLYSSGLESDPNTSILVNHREREGFCYEWYPNFKALIKPVSKETSFIYPGLFWKPPESKDGYASSRKNMQSTISAFVIDIDRDLNKHFLGDWLVQHVLEVLAKNPDLMPNYLMLSGNGVQLWYVFGKQIPLYRKMNPRRQKFNDLLRKLYTFFLENLQPNLCDVDMSCATINHAFRAPGSPAKLGFPTRLFSLNMGIGTEKKCVDPLVLSRRLRGSLKPYDVEPMDKEAYEKVKQESLARKRQLTTTPATEKQFEFIQRLYDRGFLTLEDVADVGSFDLIQADALIKKGTSSLQRTLEFKQTNGVIHTSRGHDVVRKPRHPGWYYDTLAKLPEKTGVGNRYKALFCLAGIAYNCNIPRAQLERDMNLLLETDWAKRKGSDGRGLSKRDIKAAMTGWKDLGTLRKRELQEELLGWSYAPPAKRNGRTRRDHLEEVHNYRNYTTDRAITRYLKENPSARKSEVIRATGYTRQTVDKHWENARRIAGLTD